MSEAICGTCPYWHTSVKGEYTGECRVCSPARRNYDEAVSTEYDYWCGEHPARKEQG